MTRGGLTTHNSVKIFHTRQNFIFLKLPVSSQKGLKFHYFEVFLEKTGQYDVTSDLGILGLGNF